MTVTRVLLGAVAVALLVGCSMLPLPLTDAQRIWCDDNASDVRYIGMTLGVLRYTGSERPTPDEAQGWDRSCRAAYDMALRRP